MDENRALNISGEIDADTEPDIFEPEVRLIEEDWYGEGPADRNQHPDEGEAGVENDLSEDEPDVPQREADQSFRLKYLGEEIEVSREEMIRLAQKGKDYDRIRSRADALSDTVRENSGYLGFLEELAKKSGQSLADFVGKTRTAMRASGEIPASQAGVRQSANVASVGSDEQHTGGAQVQSAAGRRNREVAEFIAEYRDIDPRSIPREVWDGVKSGKTLLASYQSYENRLLRAQIDAERQNLENRLKTAGSRATAGTPRPRSEIEDDWYNND